MRRILISFCMVLVMLLTLTGCGGKAHTTFRTERTARLIEYEATKMQDDLEEHMKKVSRAYTSMNAIIFDAEPGKESIKYSLMKEIMKEVKSSLRKVKRVTVPKRIEQIHDIFLDQLYLVEEGFELLQLGYERNDHYMLSMGQSKISVFFDFYKYYRDFIDYFETEDFNPQIVASQLEKIRLQGELSLATNKIEVMEYIQEHGRNLFGMNTVEPEEPTTPPATDPTEPTPIDPPMEEPQEPIHVPIEDSYELDKNYITQRDLDFLSSVNINLLKNAIYARHGYIFEDSYLNTYFINKEWYRPDPTFSMDSLNEIEKKNVEMLSQEEQYRQENMSIQVTSYRDAWEILTSELQYYSVPDLSDNESVIIFKQPFYMFSAEHFNSDGVAGDVVYLVSAEDRIIYEFYSNGDIRSYSKH